MILVDIKNAIVENNKQTETRGIQLVHTILVVRKKGVIVVRFGFNTW